MKKIEHSKDQDLREVRVYQVWLKDDLLKNKKKYYRVHPGLWKIFNSKNEKLDEKSRSYISSLKDLIIAAEDLFIIFLDTRTKTEEGHSLGGYAFLTDRKNFVDITLLMAISNLAGCRFKVMEPPFEDFINEFISEVYF